MPVTPSSPPFSCWVYFPDGCPIQADFNPAIDVWLRDDWGEANANAGTQRGCAGRADDFNGWCSVGSVRSYYVGAAPPNWAARGRDTPFSFPFELHAFAEEIWLRFDGERNAQGRPLRLKGTNWAGFQASGCVHELWRHGVQEYVDFLVAHRFNAVRLPLSAALVTANSFRVWGSRCGAGYSGWETLDILDDVLTRLRDAGIFVMLDMHTLTHPESTHGAWCVTTPCTPSNDGLIFNAWEVLARRYCSYPNVIMADVYNEPWEPTWTQWRDFVQRIGSQILGDCPRWLIVAEGDS